MEEKQRLELGIEIVAAMKASCYDYDIEKGRIAVFTDTEIDRLEGISKDEFDDLSSEDQEKIKAYCEREKERLHKQALYVADIAIAKYIDMEFIYEYLAAGENHICPTCGSDKAYATKAIHCCKCATTTEMQIKTT